MNRLILLASLLTLTLWPIVAVQARVPAVKPLLLAEPQLTPGNVSVTVVESAVVFYAAKVPTTTLVFVIEHLGEQDTTTSSSNVNFLNAEREKIVTAVPDDEQMRESGSAVDDFHDYLRDRRKFISGHRVSRAQTTRAILGKLAVVPGTGP
ncbi:MAG: hypothetical protein ACK6A8_15425 [Planctomycetota bacterium]|jgi:hypothetical protein